MIKEYKDIENDAPNAYVTDATVATTTTTRGPKSGI